MAPDDRSRPRFEPPPWEAEAFERFRLEQERMRAARDLETALAEVRQGPRPDDAADAPQDGPDPPATPERPPGGTTEAGTAESSAAQPVSDTRVEAMLAELRVQEHTPPGASKALVNAAIGVLGSIGAFVVVEAFVLFGTTRGADQSVVLLAAMASLIMLSIGAGCIAGAVVLYRKHHQ